MLHMVCLFGNSQGKATIFTKTTQNVARTANVFASQSKMHILKSSGFTDGTLGKVCTKSNQNQNVESNNRESKPMFIIKL